MTKNLPANDAPTAPQPSAANLNSFSASAVGWLGAAGAALTASALLNRRSARKAEADTPPAGSFVTVDEVRLHYVDRGQGPVVVLLHGNTVTLQDFKVSGVLDCAAASHRVIAFDRPGFGYSDRPRARIWTPAAQAALIASALKQLGVDGAVLVGHSWGSMVALGLALDHPELVSGLVLISGYYYPTARADVLPAAIQAVPGLGDLLTATISPLAARLTGPLTLQASFAPAPVSDKMKNFPVGLTLRPSQLRAAAAEGALMIPAAIALSRRYEELDLPMIVMAGDGDLITNASEHSKRFAREVADAELQMVPGQGHLLHFAVPTEVAASIGRIVQLASERRRSKSVRT